MPSLHTTRLLLEVRTSAETLPAETLDAIEHALIYADSNRELGVLCTTRVSLLDPAIAMHVGLLADIDAYLAKQPVEEPEDGDEEGDDTESASASAEEHGGWEVAQALRNIIAKHRYDAYCAHSRKFNLQPLNFERWKEMQAATRNADGECFEPVPGMGQSICTREAGHAGEHRCKASDVDARKGR